MDPLEIARWQFGITTVYHFLMVPLTIGLGLTVAVLQTAWHRTGREEYLRMTKFWGKLFLINFIMGVATGIVQEFQFGMAWSEYSRFVGDVFGALLAMEALLAFFVESIFLGLWIFGWDRLPRILHLGCIWMASLASILSAYFILVANSWMQHPVGVDMVGGRAVMTDAWAVFTNSTALVTFPHTVFGAFSVAGGFLLGLAWYHLYRRRALGIDTVDAQGRVVAGEDPARGRGRDRTDYLVWIKSLRIGAAVAMVSFAGVALSGHHQAQLMFEQQPMKMAAAEAACHDGTGFSVLSLGNLASEGATTCEDVVGVYEVPGLLSYLANGDFTTEVKGVNTLLPEYQEKYGTHLPDDPMYGERAGEEINYLPLMEVTYWGFRLMITFGGLAAFAALVALWMTRRGTVPDNRWISRLAVLGILAPFAANSAGWIFTEMGRQPFVVVPNPTFDGIDQVFMFTAAAVSPGVGAGELLFSTIALATVYAVLLVVEVVMLVRYVRGGVPAAMPELAGHDDGAAGGARDGGDVLAFAY
ncbi:putative integral membrane cytochrome D ubiquinol oxidase (Subunit I) CydA [Zafaria cholistanensis]|uniref:Putative integral membrane cytochrome D ubiquinol oxidase (Subunit I) CydA n=1 Tax=Zafaria cholistanensis TaxID=1682741 RepID=A0A5A7NRK4_9MICC|nr:cytochrome ubiquinol oxidase subunit I [Zafaria cholistanensis]GER23544.1 putative integral membrane cytochrome D ubiquinol oxidase (Subunit I) CydA [Zafaria cholistanensis]